MNLWQRIAGSLGGRHIDADLDQEIQSHIEQREEQLIAQGMRPGEARREARRQFGNRLRIQEDVRAVDLFPWLESTLRELRQAFRALSARPGLVAVAVSSLALGIGANAVLFSAMDAVFWKPLPVRDVASLVDIQQLRETRPTGGNPARARDYDQRLTTVEGVGGYYTEGVIVPSDAGPRRVRAFRTFGPLARILGVAPVKGRAFTRDEEWGAANVAWITDSYWRAQFNGDADVLGRQIRTGTGAFTIVGILPASAAYPREIDFWAPADKGLQGPNRAAAFMGMTARLRPGVTREKLDAELRALNAALAAQYPDTDRGVSALVQPLRDEVAGEARLPLLVTWGAVGVVLLIACLNIASLLLARGLERTREATIRAALGASRWTLVRTFLAESLLLSFGGAITGLLVAVWGIDLLAGLVSTTNRPALDGRVLVFAFFLALACALLFGLIPAWQTARAGIASNLNELARSSAGVRRLWLRGAMVVAQAALSLLLLGVAGLFLASFENQRQAPLGFVPENLIAVKVDLSWDTDRAKLHGFTREVLSQLGALPGVEQVAMTDRLPLAGESQSGEIKLRGRELAPLLAKTKVHHRSVSDGYFATLHVPIRAGRAFESRPNVHEAVVNETFARTFFPNENPIGQVFAQAREKSDWMTIVGVTGDLRSRRNAAASTPEFYHSFDRSYWPLLTFVARTNVPADRLAPAVREAIRGIDPNQIVESVATVEDELGAALNWPRRFLWVSAAFALVALSLALIGLYGVMASDVHQRRREFGIRLALGATRSEVLRQSLWRGAKLALVGVALGVAISLVAQRQAAALLYGVAPGDPRWLAAAALVLLVAALVATWRPAWRGASLDPAITLRHE